jgi:hypothetical protein
MKIIRLIKCLIFEKNEHFLSVDGKIYNRYKLLIKIAILLNKNYKPCEIERFRFKYLRNFVVVGLKYSGRNVKRRTSGYAKTFIKENKDSKCIYCEKALNDDNATTDHILPISKGGNNCQVNLIVVCKDCNTERGDMDFKKFLSIKNIRYKSIKFT